MNIFKKILIILFLLFLSSNYCPKNVTSQEVFFLSLKDAINIACNKNKIIQIQEQEIKASKATMLSARSEFLPKIGFTLGYNYTESVLNLGISPQILEKDMGMYTGYKNENKVGVSFYEPIYTGGARLANLNQSKIKYKIQQEILRARKFDVIFETKRLYYGLLLAHQSERITRDLYNQTKLHYKDVRNKFEQGIVSKYDLLKSKVQISKVTPALIKARNSVSLIESELKKLLDFDDRSNLILNGSLKYKKIKINKRIFLNIAYVKKPEIILQSLGADVSRLAIDLAKATNRPQVVTTAGYFYKSDDYNDMFNTYHRNWSAGFSVSVPIFDGFSSKAKVDEAKAKYNKSGLEKENIRNQVLVDVTKACLNLKEAEAIVKSQKENIKEAKEALRIAEVSYDNGEATNLDVLDAQVSLSEIRKNMSEGIYDYLMAKAYLERTIGKNLEGELEDERY